MKVIGTIQFVLIMEISAVSDNRTRIAVKALWGTAAITLSIEACDAHKLQTVIPTCKQPNVAVATGYR